jgi:hypothetical protein
VLIDASGDEAEVLNWPPEVLPEVLRDVEVQQTLGGLVPILVDVPEEVQGRRVGTRLSVIDICDGTKPRM